MSSIRLLMQGMAIAAAIPLAGCMQSTNLPLEPASAALQSAIDPNVYVLAPGDKVRISVYGEPDLTGEYLVMPGGSISYPLVGDFPASGKTATQLREALAARLAQGIVRDPRVTAEVSQYRDFYIFGEVQKPGKYPYTAGLTVETAVAIAGGYTYRANNDQVIVRREADKSQHRYAVDEATPVPVQPGDTLRIPERYF